MLDVHTYIDEDHIRGIQAAYRTSAKRATMTVEFPVHGTGRSGGCGLAKAV